MMTIYEKLVAGETLRVRFKNPVGVMERKSFTIKRLLMLGDYSVTESSEWAQFATVGGIMVNNKRKERMSPEAMQYWCEQLEEVVESDH
jgi:hypothetical protein